MLTIAWDMVNAQVIFIRSSEMLTFWIINESLVKHRLHSRLIPFSRDEITA